MKRPFRGPKFLTSLFAASLASTAVAGEGGGGDPSSEAALPEVVVTGDRPYKPSRVSSPKYTAPLRDIPQTVTVVPQAVIEEQGAATLRDVLRNVPGISIQAGEGGVPAGDNLSIRGFGARTDLFIDGVRDFGGYARDPFAFEQIEVTKGPSSSTSGRGSTGGSVNMATKAPRAESFRQGSVSLGSANYERVVADVNQTLRPLGLERAAARVNLLWHDADAPGRDHARNRRWGVAPSLAFGLGQPTKVTLTYLHLDQYAVPDYGIPWVPETNNALVAHRGKPAPVDFRTYYGLVNRDFERTITDAPTLIVSHDFGDAATLRALSRYGRTYRNSIITAPRFASNNSTDITRELKARDQVDAVMAQQLNLVLRLGEGPVKHDLVLGAEAAREESNNTPIGGSNGPVTDLWSPDPGQTYLFAAPPSTATFATSETYALYAFDTIRLGERLELSGGARYERFDVSARVHPVAGSPTRLGRLDEMISGRAGVVFKPLPIGSVYAGYGVSFNPSAEALTLGNTATSANSVNVAPEESRSWELGTKWDVLGEALALGAAVFRTEKLNSRTEDPSNAFDFVVLEGRQRVDGFELNAAGSPLDGWNVFGAYTYLDGKVLSSKNVFERGSPLSNTPRHSASLWSTWSLPWELEVGAGAQHVGARFSASTATRRRAPGYTTVDAMLSRRFGRRLTARLNAYNLADHRYIDRVGGGHFTPGPGRWLQGTLDVRF